MLSVQLLTILFFSLLLIKSADLVIVALRRLSKQMKTGVFALSAILLALGTSFPELFVGLTSSLEGEHNLSIGLVLGSNIANTALIVGFAALVHGKVRVHGKYFKRDVWVALVAGLLPLFLILDGNLSRVDGLILLTAYGGYATSFFRSRFMQIAEEQREESFFYRFMRQFNHIDSKRRKEMGKLFIGIALLLFSADMIVKVSGFMAESIGIPVFLIGLLVISVGTSLPELAFSLRSLRDHEPSMFFGNVLGSTIVNSTLVIGMVGFINPTEIVAVDEYVSVSISFVIVFSVFWVFVRTKHRLDRWEAALLLLLYLTFIGITLVQ